MERVTELPSYLVVKPEADLPELKQRVPFKAVVVLEAASSNEWQHFVSERIVAAGCRYVMAWGEQCERFHDSVDSASLERYDYDVPAEQFIMTTWHDDESLENVFWFAQFCADLSNDEVQLQKTVILHISHIDREAEYLDLYTQSRTLAEREEGENSA